MVKHTHITLLWWNDKMNINITLTVFIIKITNIIASTNLLKLYGYLLDKELKYNIIFNIELKINTKKSEDINIKLKQRMVDVK